MIYIAFTIGLFGSLHCIGMCGPLAIAFSQGKQNNAWSQFGAGLSYNLGRTLTYAGLGLLFGILGSFLLMIDLQKTLSIVLGVLLVIAFLFSIDIDQKINNNFLMGRIYARIRTLLSSMMQNTKKYPPFILGMANGLLPCGLVYLALAGSISTGNLIQGMLFMTFFGLGTLPALITLSMGSHLVSLRLRRGFRKVLPFVSLAFGLFLIYRGIVVDMPEELNFWEAWRNPVMCH